MRVTTSDKPVQWYARLLQKNEAISGVAAGAMDAGQ